MAISSVNTSNMSREEWLAERRKSIGGSEIGAILGINSYESSYSVWAKKLGLIPDAEDNEAMRQGRDLEEYVAQRFSERSGLKVQKKNAIVRSDDFPHLHANIDRKIVGVNAGLECKTASALSMKNFKDGEFPESYYAQCVAYMAVLGYDRYYLAALILGKAFQIYQLTRHEDDVKPDWCESSFYVNDDEFKYMRQAAIEFWQDNVIAKVPPRHDGSASTTAAINYIYSDGNGESVELINQDLTIQMIQDIKANIKDLETQKEMLEQNLKEEIGNAESGFTKKYFVTWRAVSRDTFDSKKFMADHNDINFRPYMKSSSSRRLTIKEVKHDEC